MASPFPPSGSAPGKGNLVVRLLPHNISALAQMTFQYPLKLISPSPSAGQKSVLVFLLTYGGGLVGGDQIDFSVVVQTNAKLSLATQGHTKIFKSPKRDVATRQQLNFTLESGSAVCLLPDPIQPFEGSVYQQSQVFTLADDSSLCLLDWCSAGRSARGERWDFRAYNNRNEVWSLGNGGKRRLLLRDNVVLEGSDVITEATMLKKKMQGIGIFGSLILKGPLVGGLAEFFLSEFTALPRIGARDFRSDQKRERDSELTISHHESWRISRLQQEKDDGLLWSAAKVRGCTIVKFGARTVEGGRTWIGEMIKDEGSISRIFGEDSTMCVR